MPTKCQFCNDKLKGQVARKGGNTLYYKVGLVLSEFSSASADQPIIVVQYIGVTIVTYANKHSLQSCERAKRARINSHFFR